MSQRALRLPIRTLSTSPSHNGVQWVCRRCLATTAASEKTPMSPPLVPHKASPETAASYDPSLPTSQRDYRLKKSDFYLKKAIPQPIPVQYLVHSTSSILAKEERIAREEAKAAHKPKRLVGVVVSSGKMHKTVKVRLPGQRWNNKIHKYFQSPTTHLVHDPNSSLNTGDVVSLHRLRVSTQVHHVVAEIISPFGTPLAERPPVPTADERLAAYKEKRFAKLHRRSLRREAAKGNEQAISDLRRLNLNPGKGVQAGKGEKSNVQQGVGKERTPTPKDGAILGSKGQKLLDGVLPGGRHEVGKIQERAQSNKEKAVKMESQAKGNLAEADAIGEELSERGLEAESVVDKEKQGPISKEEGVRENIYGTRP